MEKNVQDFKKSYESPRLYLDNYFSDTRNRVDIEAELKIIKFNADSNVHDKINQIRQGMINKIDSFEEECIQNFGKQSDLISQFSRKISNLIKIENKGDEQMIENIFLEFKKILFLNRALHFFISNQSQSEITKEYFGKLLHIDMLFSEKCLNFLLSPINDSDQTPKMDDSEEALEKENESLFFDKNITNEKLKAWCLKQELYNNQEFSCSDGFIVEIEFEHFINRINYLDLKCLNLHSIDSKCFDGFRRLKSIDLCDNKLQMIPSNTFQLLENLIKLQLTFNMIESFEVDTFKGLKHLNYLFAEVNQIKSIKALYFYDLSNLKLLYLDGNQITDIENESFKGLPFLTQLGLQHNKLVAIKSNYFRFLRNLEILFLDGNEIKEIEPGSFSDLNKLIDLRFDFNQLTTIKKHYFNSLFKLQHLMIGTNKIEFIEEDSFIDLKSSLTHLGLQNNRLKCIKKSYFRVLSNIKELYLDGNEIDKIEAKSFEGLKFLNKLWLNNDQISHLVQSIQ